MKLYQVVFHLDEPGDGRTREVLANIENLLNDLGEDAVEVELLANGGGVAALKRDPGRYAEPVGRLMKRGVRFVACNNSMRNLDIKAEDLMDGVDIVPAGVTELVKRQSEGWAYIRP